MAPLLYLIACMLLTGVAVSEVRGANRASRLRLVFTLLYGMVFSGAFGLLVMAARCDGGAYRNAATAAAMLLSAGALLLFTAAFRRLRPL